MHHPSRLGSLWLLSLAALTGAETCDWADPIGATTSHVLDVRGTHRTYRLHRPPMLDPSRPLPLIVALHGAGNDGAIMEFYSHLSQLADRESFLVAYPDAGIGPANAPNKKAAWLGRFGGPDDDVVFLAALLDEIERQQPVDPHHVMIAGTSSGGIMAYRAGLELADRLTAIGAVCGTMCFELGSGESAAPRAPACPLSLIAIHGRQDPAVPYDGGDRNISRFWAVERSVGFWVAHDACAETSLRTFDGFTYRHWQTPADAVAVELITVDPAGHALDDCPAFNTWLAVWEFLVRDRPCRLSPARRTFVDELAVRCPMARVLPAGASLRYTVDGSAPVATSTVCSGTVTLGATATVRVAAFVGDRCVSGDTAETFRRLLPRAPDHPQHTVPGLRWDYFEGGWDHVPDTASMQSAASGECTLPDLTPRRREHQYALAFTGFLSIQNDGVFTISTTSDDGSVVDIGGVRVVDNDGLHAAATASGRVFLAAGLHAVRIAYVEATGGSEFSFGIHEDGKPARPLAPSDFVHD